jgi:teichuronic acid biosynthesis glycosyltransferase TuaC
LKILTFTTLYPDTTRSRHGIFVETRLRQLIMHAGIEARVVAPVPWFPSKNPMFGDYVTYAGVSRQELHHGIEVYHPRYPLLPKIGMSLTPWLMAQAVKPTLQGLLRDGYDFDVIDAHYFYPDGVAAALLARTFRKPLVITARGSDLNLIANLPLPRKWILWAARRADHLITVSAALKQVLVEMGAHPSKITVLRNGVDVAVFKPVERDTMRRELGVSGFVLLSIGNLIPAKGHDLVIEAVAHLPDTVLLIIGQGPDQHRLRQLIADRGLEGRVRILGNMEQDALRDYYGVADALVLASAREGWPNVLLESMACGTPVIATAVGAAPDIVAAPEAGVLAAERSTAALLAAIRQLRDQYPDRAATRAYAEQFSWDEISIGQMQIFNRMIQAHVV